MRNPITLLLSFFLLLSPLTAAERFEFWPGASYDAGVPTLEKVAGHRSGERITTPADIVKYLEALAAARPSQMKMWEYARTWEDRPLVYAVIGSEANIRRLSEIQAGIKALTDPRKTSKAEADRLIASLPALVWLAYGVHGNEISSPDAALMTAYHLLAAKNEDVAKTILKDVLVIIDPLQNPDGRNRFVNHFVQSEGLIPNANPEAIEHTETWPGGRSNHYLFDMNRDWFALTQPETQGRIKVLQEWFPQVFVDLHEMGGNSTYYFAPEAVPYNPHLAKEQREALDWFGQNNAKWFDHYGISYFTREVFDAFYPGYGASWPNYWGSVAMTYEQASSRGLVMRRSVDGVTFHFRQTVKQHFIASLSTAEAAAKNRERLLKNFYAYNVSAIEEGKTDKVQAFALPRTGDVSAVDKLADLLAVQGIEVQRTKSAITVGDKDCPAGSYVINLAQPKKRLIRTLLDPDVPMEEDFLKEQERRRSKNLPDEIYDVVGWSLPLMYNVELASSAKPVTGDFEAVPGGKLPEGTVDGGQASVAYLVPWGTNAAGRLLTAAMLKDLTAWTADKTFELNGRKFPRGTLIFKVADNSSSIHSTMAELAKTSGAEVFASNTAYVVKGISLGSNDVIPMKKPNIAIAWDEPTSSLSAGATRFVIERQFGYPTTPIRTRNLAGSVDLDRFDVLILPDARGGYARDLGEAGLARLKGWVRNGGTLIALSAAVADLADPKVDLLSISREYQPREGEEKKTDDKKEKTREARVPGKIIEKEEDWKKAIEPKKEAPDSVAGVLALANLDPDNWVTAGIAESVNVMVQGPNIYAPITLDKGVNAAVFAGPGQLVKSGYMWDENRKQTAYKPFVVVQRTGKGHTVGFTADPNFRAYMDGLNILFLNSIFRSQPEARGTGMMATESEW